MTGDIFDHLAGITSVILFIWSAVLLWASIKIRRIIRALAEERRELRRWKRMQNLRERQNQKWQ